MKATQKEAFAKWILAAGAAALFLVSLTAPTMPDRANGPVTSEEISQDDADHDLAGKSYRSFYSFVASLC